MRRLVGFLFLFLPTIFTSYLFIRDIGLHAFLKLLGLMLLFTLSMVLGVYLFGEKRNEKTHR